MENYTQSTQSTQLIKKRKTCKKWCKCDQCIIERFKRNPIPKINYMTIINNTPFPPKCTFCFRIKQ